VRLRLTHELIGQLVGAKRPTVSLALRELDERGTVYRRSDGSWLLEQAWTTPPTGQIVGIDGAGVVPHVERSAPERRGPLRIPHLTIEEVRRRVEQMRRART
jgi:hypothetical protein